MEKDEFFFVSFYNRDNNYDYPVKTKNSCKNSIKNWLFDVKNGLVNTSK